MKKLLIVAGILIAAFVLIQFSRSDFRAFEARREAWYQRGSAYVGSTATRIDPVRATECNRELAELVAYAKQKGWTQ